MDKEQSNFPKDFFKQFKSKEDFQSFFSDLYKQGVEEMLKAELDEHLGYEKHSSEGWIGSTETASEETVNFNYVLFLKKYMIRDDDGKWERNPKMWTRDGDNWTPKKSNQWNHEY